jgi:hypothetical protein
MMDTAHLGSARFMQDKLSRRLSKVSKQLAQNPEGTIFKIVGNLLPTLRKVLELC